MNKRGEKERRREEVKSGVKLLIQKEEWKWNEADKKIK
jgi:hypothetical protein